MLSLQVLLLSTASGQGGCEKITYSVQHTLSGKFSAADVPGAVPNAGNMGVVR